MPALSRSLSVAKETLSSQLPHMPGEGDESLTVISKVALLGGGCIGRRLRLVVTGVRHQRRAPPRMGWMMRPAGVARTMATRSTGRAQTPHRSRSAIACRLWSPQAVSSSPTQRRRLGGQAGSPYRVCTCPAQPAREWAVRCARGHGERLGTGLHSRISSLPSLDDLNPERDPT